MPEQESGQRRTEEPWQVLFGSLGSHEALHTSNFRSISAEARVTFCFARSGQGGLGQGSNPPGHFTLGSSLGGEAASKGGPGEGSTGTPTPGLPSFLLSKRRKALEVCLSDMEWPPYPSECQPQPKTRACDVIYRVRGKLEMQDFLIKTS